jgi:hypothetical protein
MMWKDPFVEELHALRAEMTQALGGNMHRYAEHLRRAQQQRFAANEQTSVPQRIQRGEQSEYCRRNARE